MNYSYTYICVYIYAYVCMCVYIHTYIYVFLYLSAAGITALLLYSTALKKMNLFKQVNFPTEMDQTQFIE